MLKMTAIKMVMKENPAVTEVANMVVA